MVYVQIGGASGSAFVNLCSAMSDFDFSIAALSPLIVSTYCLMLDSLFVNRLEDLEDKFLR